MVVAVVVPYFNEGDRVNSVIREIPSDLPIVVVDDASAIPLEDILDPDLHHRVDIIRSEVNEGVGASVTKGLLFSFRQYNAEWAIKVDGDGQMPLEFLPKMLELIRVNTCDFIKGTRFSIYAHRSKMPKLRIFGNLFLQILSRFSTGYWQLTDPNNGFIAISFEAFKNLNLAEIDDRFFFETSLLAELGKIDGRIVEIPMPAIYNDEKSHLIESKVFSQFLLGNVKKFAQRIIFQYFLKDINLGSFLILLFLISFFGSISFALVLLEASSRLGVPSNCSDVAIFQILVHIWLASLSGFFYLDSSKSGNLIRRVR